MRIKAVCIKLFDVQGSSEKNTKIGCTAVPSLSEIRFSFHLSTENFTYIDIVVSYIHNQLET